MRFQTVPVPQKLPLKDFFTFTLASGVVACDFTVQPPPHDKLGHKSLVVTGRAAGCGARGAGWGLGLQILPVLVVPPTERPLHSPWRIPTHTNYFLPSTRDGTVKYPGSSSCPANSGGGARAGIWVCLFSPVDSS